jgi:hypothetical protein
MYLIRKLPTIGKRIALALPLCTARMMIDLSPKMAHLAINCRADFYQFAP